MTNEIAEDIAKSLASASKIEKVTAGPLLTEQILAKVATNKVKVISFPWKTAAAAAAILLLLNVFVAVEYQGGNGIEEFTESADMDDHGLYTIASEDYLSEI